MKLAVLILTYNEELHIAECIQSASFADEIIVIDSGSTDTTIDIAKNLGAKVVLHPMNEGFAAQRNFALNQTEAEWVLFLDADERITPVLAEKIRDVILSGQQACYVIQRHSIVFGHKVKHGVCRMDEVIRLFPRNKVTWNGIVHEKIDSDLPVKKLQAFMYHYTYTSWDRYFIKFNQYTTLWAQGAYEKGKRTNPAGIFLHAIFGFIQMLILKRGFLDGFYGLVLCCFHFSYTMAKYLKLYELQKQGGIFSK